MTAQTKHVEATNAVSRQHYSKAPILEAVLRIVTVGEMPAAAVAEMHPLIAESYPTKKQVFELDEDEAGDRAASKFVGYDFADDLGKNHVAARATGLSFRQLGPYDRWETFSAEAKRAWTSYRSLTRSPIEWI